MSEIFIEYCYPWRNFHNEKEQKNLEQELNKELHPGHVLFGKQLRMIARRDDDDDILVQMVDTETFAVVHLTWSGGEEDGEFPYTEKYNTLREWMEKRMLPDQSQET